MIINNIFVLTTTVFVSILIFFFTFLFMNVYLEDKLIAKIEDYDMAILVFICVRFICCFLIISSAILFLKFSWYQEVSTDKEFYNVIEEYEIVKGKTQTRYNGNGFGFATFYRMSFDNSEELSFYFQNDDNEYEIKTVCLDFKIKEIDEDRSYYRVYKLEKKHEICSQVFGCETETVYLGKENKLYVPKGTVTDGSGVILD